MPFNALILDDTREKAIQLMNYPYLGFGNDFGDEAKIFWVPRKCLSRKKILTAFFQPQKTKTGKTIYRIYYKTWAYQLIQDAYNNGYLPKNKAQKIAH